MNNAIVKGSLAEVAQSTGKQIRNLFPDVDLIIMLDTSLSMSALDGTDKSRYERSCEEIEKINNNHPGKTALISWSSESEWCWGGIPTFRGNSTDLAGALRFAKSVDNPYVTFCVISDGEPDDEQAALEVSASLKAKINTVYVGSKMGRGRDFLQRLASSREGTYNLNEFGKELGATVARMLEVV